MKIELILVTLIFVSALFMYNQEASLNKFQMFQSEWNKKYSSSEEYSYRMSIFYQNLAEIEAHNADPKSDHQFGLTQFSDLTDEEFQKQYLGGIPDGPIIEEVQNDEITFGDIDWEAQGKVSPVKNQGACGSCWAFSVVATIESLLKIKQPSKYATLSEQMLVDCDKSNMGCNGGNNSKAFNFVKTNGLKTDKDYPYIAKDEQCKFGTGEYKISSYSQTSAGNCNALGDALQKRTISVFVDANKFNKYQKGTIFSDCGSQINHLVLLVAVNQSAGYWRIKNSWGTRWGDDGYMKLKFPGSTCGLCMYPAYPEL